MKNLTPTILILLLSVNIQVYAQNASQNARQNKKSYNISKEFQESNNNKSTQNNNLFEVVKEVKILKSSNIEEYPQGSGIIISNLKNSPKGEVDLKFWPEDFNEQAKSSPDPNGNDDIYIILAILDALRKAKNGTQLSVSPTPNPISNGTVTIAPMVVEMSEGKPNSKTYFTLLQYPYTRSSKFSINKDDIEDYALFFSKTYGRVSKIIADKLAISEGEINEGSNFNKMLAGNPEMQNEEGFVLFITKEKNNSDQFLEASFSIKGSNDVKLKTIIPTNDKDFIQKMFELSDQSENYELKLLPTNEKPQNNESPFLLFNAWGDVVSMETHLGRILSFSKNYDNVNTLFGGTTDHFRKAQNNNSNVSTWITSGPPVQEADGKGTKRTTSQAQTKPELL